MQVLFVFNSDINSQIFDSNRFSILVFVYALSCVILCFVGDKKYVFVKYACLRKKRREERIACLCV